MKKRTKLGMAGVVAVGVLTIAGLSVAQGRDNGSRGPGKHGRHVMEALDLSAEQRSAMMSLRTQHMKERARLNADIEVARIELEDVLKGRNPKDSDVKKAVSRLSEVEKKKLEMHVAHRLAIARVLTDAQRDKLESLGPPMRGPGGRGGHGMRGGPESGFGFGRGHRGSHGR